MRLVEGSGIFNLQPSEGAPTSAGRPDAFFYKLSLSEGSRKKTLSFNDVTAPAVLHPLLAFFGKLALDQRQKGKWLQCLSLISGKDFTVRLIYYPI